MSVVKTLRHFTLLLLLAAAWLLSCAANRARAATSEYFDTNGATTGSGVTAGGSYTWEGTKWNLLSNGNTSVQAWAENDFPRFSAGTDANAKAYTITANSNHTVAGMFTVANGGGQVTLNGPGVFTLLAGNDNGFFVNAPTSSSLTINNTITGGATGTLVWQNSTSGGSLFLYGNNTYVGDTFLNTGAGLNYNSANSFGTSTIKWGYTGSTVTSVTLAAPALASDITMSNPMITRTGANTVTAQTLTLGNQNGHKVTWSGQWTLTTGSTSTLAVNSGVTDDISGLIIGTDSATGFVKSQTGTLILSNSSNSFQEQVTVANGILSTSGIGNSGSNSNLGRNGTIGLGATTTTGTLVYTGSGETSDKVLNLAGTTGGAVLDQSGSGTGNLKFTSDMTATGAGAKTLTLQGATSATGEIAGKIVENGGGTSVLKQGSGTWTLDGVNTYTGGTTVIAGTLGIGNNSALGTGPLTLGGTSANTPTITAAGGSRTIGNNITLAAVTTGNATIAGSNALTINGTTTVNGADRTFAINNSANTTLGTIDLSESAGSGRKLTITGSGNVTLGGTIENVAGGGGTAGNLTFNASYSGTATINGTNTYSGATTLSAGTFVLGNKAAFGTSSVGINGVSISANTNLSGANAIGNSATLGGDNTFTGSNPLEFSGTVAGTGNRTVTNNMTANLTFSGPVNIRNSGTTTTTLTMDGTGNTTVSGVVGNGSATTANLTKNGNGTLTLTNTNTYNGVTTIGGGTLQLGNGGGTGSLDTGGTIVDNGNLTINRSNAVAQGTDFSGSAITGTGSLTKTGTGTLTLNIANAHGGGTTVDNGGLALGDKSAAGTGTLKVGDTTASPSISISATTNLTGANAVTNAVTVTKDFSVTGSNNLELSGAMNLGAVNRTVTVTNTGSTTFSGIVGDGGSGTGALTKAGAGVLSLTGANTYGGGTTVSAGTLAANNTTGSATGTGAVTVGASGTLAGNGFITGAVTVNGTLSPGNSIDSLDTGALTFGGTGSSVKYEMKTSASQADLVNANGSLLINPGSALNATDAPTVQVPLGTKYTVISYSGAWQAGFHNTNVFAGKPQGSSFTVGANSWLIKYNDTPALAVNGGSYANAVTLTAVPEAGAFLIIGLGGVFAIGLVRMGKRCGISILNV
jgi:fibronectin-binding autotransporter adhesin